MSDEQSINPAPEKPTATGSSAIGSDAAALQSFSSFWWVLLLRGIALVVLGGYAFFQPSMTLVTLVQIIGIFVLVDGILAIPIGIMGWAGSRLWTLLRGALAIIIGLFVIAHPMLIGAIAAVTLVIVVSINSIAGGLLEIIVAIRERKEIHGEGWMILSGILSILFGILIASAPLWFGMVLVAVFGAFAVLFGIMLIVFSFRVKNLGKS